MSMVIRRSIRHPPSNQREEIRTKALQSGRFIVLQNKPRLSMRRRSGRHRPRPRRKPGVAAGRVTGNTLGLLVGMWLRS